MKELAPNGTIEVGLEPQEEGLIMADDGLQ